MEYPVLRPGTVAMAYVHYINRDSTGGGIHPVIVVSHDAQCERSSCVIVVPGTSKMSHVKLPTHYEPSPTVCPCMMPTRFKCENLTQIDKSDIRQVLGRISKLEYMKMQQCLLSAFHLEETEW